MCVMFNIQEERFTNCLAASTKKQEDCVKVFLSFRYLTNSKLKMRYFFLKGPP